MKKELGAKKYSFSPRDQYSRTARIVMKILKCLAEVVASEFRVNFDSATVIFCR